MASHLCGLSLLRVIIKVLRNKSLRVLHQGWDSVNMGHKKPKTLESILKRPNFSIEELLDYEMILKRIRMQDEELLSHFSSADNIQRLLFVLVRTDLSLEKLIKYFTDFMP